MTDTIGPAVRPVKVDELRIGNYICLFGHENEPVFVEGSRISDLSRGINSGELPIELNEKWFEMFGFKHTLSTSGQCHNFKKEFGTGVLIIAMMNGVVRICETRSYDNDGELSFYCPLRRVNFVHELQNLFFVLSGYELHL